LHIRQSHTQFSQELRLASPSGQPLEYVAGLFYFRNRANYFESLGIAGLGKPDTDGLATVTADHLRVAKAVFGNLTYHLTPKASLSAGARYTSEHQNIDFLQRSNSLAFVDLGGRLDKRTDNAVTYNVTGKYEWSPDLMTYLTYARGFKPGGFDITRVSTFANFKFSPETNKNIEFGLKGALLDRAVTFSGALFHTDYRNFQTIAYDGLNLVTTNAKRFITKGFELEVIARPVEGLRLQGAYAYTDARYKDFQNGQCPPTSVVRICDLSGRRLNNAAKNTFNGTAEYREQLGASKWTGFVRAEFASKSKIYLHQSLDPNMVQKGYGLWNGRLGVTSDDGLQIELWARNIFNKDALQLAFPAPFSAGGAYAGFLFEPRMVGLRASKAF
jgi:iron complex outermembrane receptor protein